MSRLFHEEVTEYLSIIRKVVGDGQDSGALRRQVHPPLIAKSIFGILDKVVTSWILSDKAYDLAEQSGQLAELILQGVSSIHCGRECPDIRYMFLANNSNSASRSTNHSARCVEIHARRWPPPTVDIYPYDGHALCRASRWWPKNRGRCRALLGQTRSS
jgi:hypothetical protein